ncbi:hypothetical protein Anapl_08349 [Anas platyrhynchos]|uniref:Uncharacterized protein n=1 Tax=Anas platyrhynchos TaxID=8839 RepID=R0M2Z5_ANAPL|nr:hypothetical protein Anapl_08349 [Anas platyrhynchos]
MIEYQSPYRGSVPCTTVGSEDLQRARKGCPGKPSARAGAGTAGDHANYQLYAGRGEVWQALRLRSPSYHMGAQQEHNISFRQEGKLSNHQQSDESIATQCTERQKGTGWLTKSALLNYVCFDKVVAKAKNSFSTAHLRKKKTRARQQQALKISARKDLQEITAPNTNIQARISSAWAATSDFGRFALLEMKLAGSGRGSNALRDWISSTAGSDIEQALFGLAFRAGEDTAHELAQRAVHNQTLHKLKTMGQSKALVPKEMDTGWDFEKNLNETEKSADAQKNLAGSQDGRYTNCSSDEV